MLERIILHLDLNYFFAACEEKRNPSLKGKAVVVCVYSGRAPDAGAVSTSNYEARKLGIKSAMSIMAAKRISKDAIYLPTDHEYYSEISERIMEILKRYADKFEQMSIDEAFLDITEKVSSSYKKAEDLAKQIKKEVLEKEKLKCSAGIGPNKLIAKIASDFQKPDGLTVVKPEEIKKFLSPMKVSKIVGVGPKTSEALKEIGVEKIEELRNIEIEKLEEVFGKNRAEWLKDCANGIDDSEVIENYEQQQMSRITTLKNDAGSVEEIDEVLERISKEVFERVAEAELFFKTVSIIAITNKYETHTKSKTFERAFNEFEKIIETGTELFEAYFRERPEEKLRRVGIRVSNFSEKDAQKTLFEL